MTQQTPQNRPDAHPDLSDLEDSEHRLHAAVEEPEETNTRHLEGWQGHLYFWICAGFTAFHLITLNLYPLETWTFRILHVVGGCVIGFGVASAWSTGRARPRLGGAERGALALVLLLAVGTAGLLLYALSLKAGGGQPPNWVWLWSARGIAATTVLGIAAGYVFGGQDKRVEWNDWVLISAAVMVAVYMIANIQALHFRFGVLPTPADFWTAIAGVLLVLELTRRMAGLALPIIAGVFILYSFIGPWLPGFLTHDGYSPERFFTYIFTLDGIFGVTTAVSSTYIILFITFAAFLQASKVSDYFVNFAFAAAGWARGGPAKVAVFASGLMGMINGTSAGNVVATGSLTIPLMRRVGYKPQSAGAIEAAASTGGQIMPPIMGAGAFIMAEITGIPYTELIVAALIPACLYFLSVYLMVDNEALRLGLRGIPREELPRFKTMVRQVYLFIPIIILIGALFSGYSVIRAGTLALASAVVVTWLQPGNRMGPRRVVEGLSLAARMTLQLVAVCACAGIIVGVIALTGVGLRFSSILLDLAGASQIIALVFAMGIAILMGMGMPTTAAYAVAASVVAPGLIRMGIDPLIAHMFVFYYSVISAITPPVALAAYAAAAISGSEPMRTSVESFKVGLAAFIVPFMFFYSPGLLMQGEWLIILQNVVTATIGVYFLSAAVVGYFYGALGIPARLVALVAALAMISGAWQTDIVGIGLGLALYVFQRRLRPPKAAPAA